MNKEEYIVEYTKLNNGVTEVNSSSFDNYDSAKRYVCSLVEYEVDEIKIMGYDVTESMIDDKCIIVGGSNDIMVTVELISIL